VTALLGGTFNPPHNGHVALAETAQRRFRDEVVVLVAVRPGHKDVELDGDTRVRLARAAFPEREVEADPHARTVDMLKAGRWRDPLFLIGADEFCDFLSWKEPNEILRLVRLAVATRPGFARSRLDSVLAGLEHPERVAFYEIEPMPFASRDLRARLEAGEDVAADLTPAVAQMVARERLYPRQTGYTGAA
jgi:nicotinate-nucleotide adenylyltransferase